MPEAFWGALNVAAVAGLCFASAIHWRVRAPVGKRAWAGWLNGSDRRGVVLFCSAGVWAALVLLFCPTLVPLELVTTLLEGRTGRMVELLHGTRNGTHAGPNHAALALLLHAPGDAAVLETLLRMNSALWLATFVLFAGTCLVVTGNLIVSAGLAALWAASQPVVHALVSECPSMLLLFYFLAGVVAASGLAIAQGSRTARLVLWLELFLLCFLAAATRIESAVFAPLVLLAACSEIRIVSATLSGWSRTASTWARSFLDRRPRLAPSSFLVVVGVVGALLLLDLAGRELESSGLEVAGLSGVRLSAPFRVPLQLARLAFVNSLADAFLLVPAGAILLAVTGAVKATLSRSRMLIAVVGLLVLLTLYQTQPPSAEGVFRAIRFNTFGIPLLLFFMPWGAAWLGDAIGWLEDRLPVRMPPLLWDGKLPQYPFMPLPPPAWPRVAIVTAAVLLCLVPRPRSAEDLHVFAPDSDPASKRNNQHETSFLLSAMKDHPDCTFLAVASASQHASDNSQGWEGLTFNRNPASLRTAPYPAALGQALAANGCVLLYKGLDCSLQGAPPCPGPPRGAEILEKRAFRNAPFMLRKEFGGHRGEWVEISLWRVR